MDRASATLTRYIPAHLIDAESGSLVDTATTVMEASRVHDLQLVWARSAASIASRPEDVERLLGLIDGAWSIEDFVPDQHMRWTLAVKSIAHALDGADERLETESARDRSDRGVRSIIRAEASRPDPDRKRDTWQSINEEGYGSDYLTRAAISGFQWNHQRELLLEFREPFFLSADTVYVKRDHAFAESYVRWLVPDRWAEPEVLARITELADELGEGSGLLRRQLREIADDVARTIRVRAFANS
jgi:aminopeptidase N